MSKEWWRNTWRGAALMLGFGDPPWTPEQRKVLAKCVVMGCRAFRHIGKERAHARPK